MGVEEEQIIEKIQVTIEKMVLIQTLFIGFISFMITGFLIYYYSCTVIIYGLCMVFGSTIGFLGIYFLLLSKPLFQTTVKTCNPEEDEELEYQSIMKID